MRPRRLAKMLPTFKNSELTPEMRAIYASERLLNFRFIAKIFATRSPLILTSADLVPPELQLELAAIGQYAALAYGAAAARSLKVDFIFDNMKLLLEPDFPLEGYDALRELVLVSKFRGTAAKVPVYVAYRPSLKQLVVAFCGTTTVTQSIYDVRTLMHSYPVSKKGCKVHTGFWKLYLGVKYEALSSIKEGLEMHEVEELVITGHSMGGALAHLLTLDLLSEFLSRGLPLKVVVLGAPRCGNNELGEYWLDAVGEYRKRHGEKAFRNYCIKAFNDGIPSLPPKQFGYRTLGQTVLYFVHGRLYHVLSSEREHALFEVHDEKKEAVLYPRGGHNYYAGLDFEKFDRRMSWVEKYKTKYGAGWEAQYKKRVREG